MVKVSKFEIWELVTASGNRRLLRLHEQLNVKAIVITGREFISRLDENLLLFSSNVANIEEDLTAVPF